MKYHKSIFKEALKKHRLNQHYQQIYINFTTNYFPIIFTKHTFSSIK